MKTYFYGLAAMVVIIAGFGFIGPSLISSRSDFLVLLGLIVVALVPIIVVGLYFRWSQTPEGKSLIEKLKGDI